MLTKEQEQRPAIEMLRLRKAGARILGGCCGTTPEHIRMLKDMI